MGSKDFTFCRTCFLSVLVSMVLCMVVAAPSTRRGLPFTDDTLMYLMNYGYLPASDMETGNLRTDEQLREAIRNLQAHGNIPVTGEVDSPTRRLIASPRCGVADVKDVDEDRRRRRRFAVHTGPRWDHTDLTWSLRTRQVDKDHGQVRRELHQALAVWSRDSNLTFHEINSEDADILIKFHRGEHGDGYAFDGPGRILAHAFFPGDDRGGDVHFDEDELWLLEYENKDDEEGTRLFSVAAHEFGHSLGLSHSFDSTSLMYPWYQSLKYDFVLPDDDRRGIQQLYGAKDRWAKIPQYVPAERRPSQRPTHQPTPPIRPTTASTTTTTTTTSRTIATYPPYHRHHHHHFQPTVTPGKPDTCDTSYDAVSIIRREMFVFKKEYMWRIGDRGVMEGYPAPIIHLWRELPHNLTHVDAVYERLDKKIVFFIGRQIYVFDGNRLEYGYPKPLSVLGLPQEVDHIDAAVVWGYNSKTYFYSGNIYWRFDEEENHVELDYPREITNMWKGMGSHFDAAFQWKDGRTYFFKGKGFWKLNDIKMRAENEQPIPSAQFWMNCSNFGVDYHPKKPKYRKKFTSGFNDAFTSGSTTITLNLYLSVMILLYQLLPR